MLSWICSQLNHPSDVTIGWCKRGAVSWCMIVGDISMPQRVPFRWYHHPWEISSD